MAGQTKEKSVCNGEDMFTMQEIRDERKLTRIRNLPVDQIADFPDHPYRVRDDQDMAYLVESIRVNGVLTPVTVRKIPGGRYEMISGHRRKRACEILGIRTIRGGVLDLDEDTAAIMMCDSNLHRSVILPSEKAFAYKMRLEAMKRKSGRPSRNVSPVGTHLRSDVQLSHEIGESRNQIHRYIRLTKLIPEILTIVDEGSVALRTAVEISYFPGNLQEALFACMDKCQCTLSHSQAARMRELLKQGKLTAKSIKTIMHAGKPVRKKKVALRDERIDKLLPEGMTDAECEEYIIRALEHYLRYQEGEQKNRQ